MGFDTEYTDKIVCPHCGYEESDSHEYTDLENAGRVGCNRCGREFWVTRNVSITYSTEKITWKLDGEKKIDRCSMCSRFEKKIVDHSGSKWGERWCNKRKTNMYVDVDENIDSCCDLEDTEADDET